MSGPSGLRIVSDSIFFVQRRLAVNENRRLIVSAIAPFGLVLGRRRLVCWIDNLSARYALKSTDNENEKHEVTCCPPQRSTSQCTTHSSCLLLIHGNLCPCFGNF